MFCGPLAGSLLYLVAVGLSTANAHTLPHRHASLPASFGLQQLSVPSTRTSQSRKVGPVGVVNGEPVAGADVYPWVAWQGGDLTEHGFYCGGTLIAPEWVLTAAHCLYDDHSIPVYIQLHRFNYSLPLEQERGVSRRVAEIVPHPGYALNPWFDDIALLRLDESVPAELVQPVRLSQASAEEEAMLLGWGSLDVACDQYDTVLRQGAVTVQSHQTCSQMAGDGWYRPETQVCAGRQLGGGAGWTSAGCGDSGGPLLVNAEGTAGENARSPSPWVQVGITAWGYGNAPDMYTRVSGYTQWIEEVMGGDSVAKGRVPTPLVLSKWGQRWLFAQDAPPIPALNQSDQNTHWRLGCASTAIAQIMFFHKLCPRGFVNVSSPGYAPSSMNFTQSAPTLCNWGKFALAPPNTSTSSTMRTVARYAYAAALVIEKEWGSGDYLLSHPERAASVSAHYGVKTTIVSLTNYSRSELVAIIKLQIARERPMKMHIANTAKTHYHHVVIDGCKLARNLHTNGTDFLVHLNIGHSGFDDGWFDFNAPICLKHWQNGTLPAHGQACTYVYDDTDYREIWTIEPLDHAKEATS